MLNLSLPNFLCLVLTGERLMPRSKRDRFVIALHKAYHAQGRVEDPTLALEELVLRLVHELLIRSINKTHMGSGAWYIRSRRDEGHQWRMWRLVECVKSCDRTMRVASGCEWLKLGMV